MKRTFSTLPLVLLLCVAAPAATIPTKVTVNATAAANATFTAFNLAGTANFTGGIGNGSFVSSISLASLDNTIAVADYTITLAAGGTLTGRLSVPVAVLTGGDTASASVSMTVTGGTGTYVAATSGTTPITLTGSVTGDLLGGFKLINFTGDGTIITGGAPPPAVPTITEVLNAASNTAGIAQGAIFIIKGSNLSTNGYTPFAPPRPTVSSGVKVTFTPTGGGAGTDAYLVYLYNQGGVNQLAAILPSTVLVGTYNVTVTNGTVSTPFAAQVVANKVGLFTQDSSGSGLASVQNYISASVVDLNRLTTGSLSGTTISPAKPGQYMLAYGTGLGAYGAGDNTTSPAFDFSKTLNIQAVVAGVSIPVAYAGRAGYAGQDQINFVLPTNIQTGCSVPFQLSVNGVLSNSTFIAIAPDASATACIVPGFTTEQLKNFDGGGTYTTGAFTLTQFSLTDPAFGTVKLESAAGAFTRLTGFQLSGAAAQDQSKATNSCQVNRTVTTAGDMPTGSVVNLDAGAITLNGPGGSNITNLALTQDPTYNSYSALLGNFGIPGQTAGGTIVPGTYTLRGVGGKGVGAFNASVTLGPTLTVSPALPSTVLRSAGLTVNWTGGNASDLVEILGSSSTTSGTGLKQTVTSATFVCTTTAGNRTFTVPASILTQLPASTDANGGFLAVASAGTPTNGNGLFTAPLTAGGSIDTGFFLGFVGVGATANYQ